MLLFLGCAPQQTVVPGGGDQRVDPFYTVSPEIDWNIIQRRPVEIWTVNGLLLDALRFFNGIEDGEPLVPTRDEDAPVFRADMLPSEIAEFFAATFSSLVQFRQTRMSPVLFGSVPGFRFDFDYVSEDGLERKGIAAGTVHEDRLYLITFTAPAEHYFPTYSPVVERMFRTIRTGGA
jgi:hypothetical protein